MVNSFRAFLVNDLFGDPALYVGLPWARRALLFDLGDISALSAGRLLKISDVFVSHTHIDHFVGFDYLLRVLLGRPKLLRLYGPPGFSDHVEGKLRGYAWNLVDAYSLSIEVHEVQGDQVRRVCFSCPEGFRRRHVADSVTVDGLLVDEPEFRVRCVSLDHRIPCLAFSLEEPVHLNVDKVRLETLGLPVGPWLMDVKRAIRAGEPDDVPIRVAWSTGDRRYERSVPLGLLRQGVVRASPGQKLVYVTDAVGSEENRERILALARDADLFFCEAGYPERDADRARARYHLTTVQAGRLAAESGSRRFAVFHLSPKYRECGGDLVAEAMAAFAEAKGSRSWAAGASQRSPSIGHSPRAWGKC
jgi:ribonuclease Z